MFFSDVKFVSSKSIVLNLIKSVYERRYSFTLISSLTDKGNITKDFLEKELCITLLKNQQTPSLFRIKTDIKKLILDSTKIKQEKFKHKLHNLTNDVTLSIDQRGDILSVTNYDTILKQWTQIKRSALDKFKGYAVEKYLQGLEDKIHNEQKLVGDIKQYRLLGFLFNGLFSSYTSSKQRSKTHLQMINHFPMTIDETYAWVKGEEKSETHIRMSGLINENETSVKKINTYFQRKGYLKSEIKLIHYEGDYRMDVETGWINQADFNMTLQYGDNYLKSQIISIKQL